MPGTVDDNAQEAGQQANQLNNNSPTSIPTDKSWWESFFTTVTQAVTAGVVVGTKQGRQSIQAGYESGLVQTSGYGENEMISIQGLLDGVNSSSGIADAALKGLFAIGNQIIGQLKMESELKRAINEETGMTGVLSENVRKEMWKAYPAVLNMGYGVEELTKYYTQLVEQTGKFTMLNQEALVRSSEVSRAFVGDLSEMGAIISNFEKVGIGATAALETINDVGVESLTLGLRSKTTIKDIGENIEKVNQYGFQTGIKGLAEMSRKATEFRMDMQDTFSIAEKVINPEGAIDLAANLQVIGGTIGDFADPLKMMYMATNNVEGLQDALIGASENLATYNSEQGKFEVSGANLRRARDMAEALGMELGSLTKTSVAAAERSKAAMDLMSTGLQMDDEDREFLMNLGTMKDGVMTIQIPESLTSKFEDTQITMSQMTSDVARALLDNRSEFKKMDARDIAQGQLTELTKMERNIGTMAAMAKVEASRQLQKSGAFTDINKFMEDENQLLLESWSGGKYKEFVDSGLGVNTKEGKAIIDGITNAYTTNDVFVKKALTKIKDELNIKTGDKGQQTVTHNGQIGLNISNINGQDQIMKNVIKNPEFQNFNLDKRNFVTAMHNWKD